MASEEQMNFCQDNLKNISFKELMEETGFVMPKGSRRSILKGREEPDEQNDSVDQFKKQQAR